MPSSLTLEATSFSGLCILDPSQYPSSTPCWNGWIHPALEIHSISNISTAVSTLLSTFSFYSLLFSILFHSVSSVLTFTFSLTNKRIIKRSFPFSFCPSLFPSLLTKRCSIRYRSLRHLPHLPSIRNPSSLSNLPVLLLLLRLTRQTDTITQQSPIDPVRPRWANKTKVTKHLLILKDSQFVVIKDAMVRIDHLRQRCLAMVKCLSLIPAGKI